MSEKLKTFLVGLASDPERMGRFLVNPAGELDGAGLSVDEKTAVLARDSAALRHALGAGPADHMTVIIPPGQKKKPRRPGAGKGGPKKPGAKKAGYKRSAAKKTGARKAAARKMSRKKASRG